MRRFLIAGRKTIAGLVADGRNAVTTCPASTSDPMMSARWRCPGTAFGGQAHSSSARLPGISDDAEHPLVVRLDRIVGDVAFDLDHGVLGAMADEGDRPVGVDGMDHRRHRIGQTARIIATFQAFSAMRARIAV